EIQRCKGQMQEALFTLDEAVAIATRSGDRVGLAIALHVVGKTHADLFEFVKATEALSEGITITRNIGWEGGLSVILNAMGQLKTRSGEYREAEELVHEAISIARRTRDRWGVALGLHTLGESFQGQLKFNEAALALEESCLLWQQQSQPQLSSWAASTLAKLKSSQGDWDSALFWHDHIITMCRDQKNHLEVANHLEQKARILLTVQRHDEAALHFEAAMLTRRDNGDIWSWKRRELQNQLLTIPKTSMKWGRRFPLLCDLKKLQQRQPQLTTASLKLRIPSNSGQL
ncbi:hypothetical protein FS837_009139, partial [Tulasnella sp. UAMH 9824]